MKALKAQNIGELIDFAGLTFQSNLLIGLATHLTDFVCVNASVGFIRYLEKQGEICDKQEIAYAGDLRGSTDRILKAIGYAIAYTGHIPAFAGKIPTPALLYYSSQRLVPAIMVTASHLPGYINGIHYYCASDINLQIDINRFRKLHVEVR